MRTRVLSLIAALCLLLSASVFAQSPPNHQSIVEKVYQAGHFNLTTVEGQTLFTEAAARALHAVNENWGHLRKLPPRTRCGQPEHACDAVLWKPTGQAVDIILSASPPSSQSRCCAWDVDEPRYAAADWLDPDLVGASVPALPVTPVPVPQVPMLQWKESFAQLFAEHVDLQKRLLELQTSLDDFKHAFAVYADRPIPPPLELPTIPCMRGRVLGQNVRICPEAP